MAIAYLIDQLLSRVPGNRSFHSAQRDVLVVPFARTAARQNRALFVGLEWTPTGATTNIYWYVVLSFQNIAFSGVLSASELSP